MTNNQEWTEILNKYEKLIYMIAHRIGGDKITNDFDDSVQEVSMSALDAVRTYSSKTAKEFKDFFHTVEFDKYIKTCLWNRKNSNGNKINKKAHIRNCISIHKHEEIFGQDDNCGDRRQSSYQLGDMKNEIVKATSGVEEVFDAFRDVNLDCDSKTIVDLVLGDAKMIKPNGSLNINKIARTLGKKKNQVKYLITKLQTQLKDYND